jgi:hypothetical protein
MANSTVPVAALSIIVKPNGSGTGTTETSEPVYGGYANGRGEIVLFCEGLAYRINFKNQTLQQRPQLNAGAQACYDSTEPGESFEYGKKGFQRLSTQKIADICTSGQFRLTAKPFLS